MVKYFQKFEKDEFERENSNFIFQSGHESKRENSNFTIQTGDQFMRENSNFTFQIYLHLTFTADSFRGESSIDSNDLWMKLAKTLQCVRRALQM